MEIRSQADRTNRGHCTESTKKVVVASIFARLFGGGDRFEPDPDLEREKEKLEERKEQLLELQKERELEQRHIERRHNRRD